MSEKDRIKWEKKYQIQNAEKENKEDDEESSPSEILVTFHRLAPSANALNDLKALDIAAGRGRNSLFLAEQGFAVDAVDISSVATDQLNGRHPKINAMCQDLDSWEIPKKQYDLIVNVRFLDQRLFTPIKEGLKPGGVLIFESFLEGTQKSGGVSHCPKYLLRKNELLHAFLGLHVIYYEERTETRTQAVHAIASLVAVNE